MDSGHRWPYIGCCKDFDFSSEMGTLEGFEQKNDENRWEGSKEKAGSPRRMLLQESR